MYMVHSCESMPLVVGVSIISMLIVYVILIFISLSYFKANAIVIVLDLL